MNSEIVAASAKIQWATNSVLSMNFFSLCRNIKQIVHIHIYTCMCTYIFFYFSFCVQLNDLVSPPLFLNVIVSTFLVCFCGFQFLIVSTAYIKSIQNNECIQDISVNWNYPYNIFFNIDITYAFSYLNRMVN